MTQLWSRDPSISTYLSILFISSGERSSFSYTLTAILRCFPKSTPHLTTACAPLPNYRWNCIPANNFYFNLRSLSLFFSYNFNFFPSCLFVLFDEGWRYGPFSFFFLISYLLFAALTTLLPLMNIHLFFSLGVLQPVFECYFDCATDFLPCSTRQADILLGVAVFGLLTDWVFLTSFGIRPPVTNCT